MNIITTIEEAVEDKAVSFAMNIMKALEPMVIDLVKKELDSLFPET